MKIYFTRHTEAEDDQRDSFGGIADNPLIDSGREYAKKLSETYKELDVQAIFTSPYLRAQETATIINEAINVDLIKLYNLRERNSYGVLSGVEKSVAPKMFPAIFKRVKLMKDDGMKPLTSVETLPGAEIYLDLVLRINDAFTSILSSKYDNVIVVTHGGVAWAFLREFLSLNKVPEKGEIIVIEGDSIDSLKINEEETTSINESLKK